MTAEGGEVGSPGAASSSRWSWVEKFSSKKSGAVASKFAYVTLLTTDSFVPGVEVMFASLKEKLPKQQDEEGRPGKVENDNVNSSGDNSTDYCPCDYAVLLFLPCIDHIPWPINPFLFTDACIHLFAT